VGYGKQDNFIRHPPVTQKNNTFCFCCCFCCFV